MEKNSAGLPTGFVAVDAIFADYILPLATSSTKTTANLAPRKSWQINK